MRQTDTYKLVSRLLYSLRTMTRRTIWGDRLFLQFQGPATILMSSRAARISDVLTTEQVNEIADAPAGAVPNALRLASAANSASSAPALPAASQTTQQAVRVHVASVGANGKVKIADVKNLDDFEQKKA